MYFTSEVNTIEQKLVDWKTTTIQVNNLDRQQLVSHKQSFHYK